MSFNWKDYLTFAENLQASPDNPGPVEAALRSATSRAYYSAFRAALELGKKDGFVPTHQGDDHQKIREHFRESAPSNPKKKAISLQLERLHDFRRQADYENTLRQKPENMALYAIGMAKIVFECIAELSK